MYAANQKIGLRRGAGPQNESPSRPAFHLGEYRLGPWTWAILALALVLQLCTLQRIDGYLLADSVEYMDRAAQVVNGEHLSASTVRSFAFSAILTPVFWLVKNVGAPDMLAVGLCRALVMALSLGCIAVVIRLGTRLFGARAGYFAGLILAINPSFLQFGVEPLSGPAAALAVALALTYALGESTDGQHWKRGLKCGAWLGVALMMAFKTIPIAAVLIVGLFCMGPWRKRGLWLSASACYLIFGILQCFLNQAVYGRFGGSLLPYLHANIAGNLANFLLKLHGFGIPGTYDLAVKLYRSQEGATIATNAGASEVGSVASSLTTRMWYLENLTADFLVWPLLAALLIGLLSVFKLRKGAVLLAAVLLVNFSFLSIKSSKSFRLLLPLLPLIAILAGLGLSNTVDLVAKRIGNKLAMGASLGALVWGLLAGQTVLANTTLNQYGAWWRAAAQVEALAEASGEVWDFDSAYNWAVVFRTGKSLNLRKLPHPMFRWPELDDDQREQIMAHIESLDAFIAHRQVLTQDPAALKRINARFEIHDIHYDERSFKDIGPLYVLVKRKPGVEPKRSFYKLQRDADPGAFQASLTNSHSVDYRRRQEDGSAYQMVLLGWDLETGLADGQIAWLTLHWYAGGTGGHDYTIVSRLTDRDNRSLEGNHMPAEGVWPTSKLEAGWVLSESVPIILPLDPEAFGGADARGSVLPVKFWIAMAEFEEQEDGSTNQTSGLLPFQPSGQSPVFRNDGPFKSSQGYRFSPDGLFQVGGLWLPIPGGIRLDDDGKNVPEAVHSDQL